MLKTLEEVRQRLITGYDPDSIILFGSYGTQHARDESDIDLLIIKDSSKNHLERHLEIDKLLSDRSVSIDIKVFTRHEVRHLYSAGSPFMEEVMETGRLIYMRKASEVWLNYDITFPVDDAIFMNSIYRGRYPADEGLLPHGEPSAEESGRAVRIAEELFIILKEHLKKE